MIGSHDTMTYLRARYRVFELFSFLWRTQTKKIREQAIAGAGYFDIRVRRSKEGWRLCHGLVDLNQSFSRLEELVDWVSTAGYVRFNPLIKDSPYIRLILERGNSFEFETQAPVIAEKFANVSFIGIKSGWRVLLKRDPVIRDYTFTPWLSGLTTRENLKRLWRMIRSGEPLTIKSHARHQQPFTGEMIKDETVYFKDMI